MSPLTIIKLLHTLVWVFFVSIIFYIAYCGIFDRVTPLCWVSIGLVVLEGLVLLYFKLSCPLTLMARKYSDSEKENFDIYLPLWLAKYNKQIFTTIFAMGTLLVLWRVFS